MKDSAMDRLGTMVEYVEDVLIVDVDEMFLTTFQV